MIALQQAGIKYCNHSLANLHTLARKGMMIMVTKKTSVVLTSIIFEQRKEVQLVPVQENMQVQ